MAESDSAAVRKAEELTQIIREIRDRVRARHPSAEAVEVDVPLADLMPVVEARDAAEAKVAAIGSVNPRPPGLINNIIQSVKRTVARALNWHIREQVEFNRAAVDCVNTAIEALNETNRALVHVATIQAELRRDFEEVKDFRNHWNPWRQAWEKKLTDTEIQFLRSVADVQASVQHRLAQVEASFRDLIRAQHNDFSAALEKAKTGFAAEIDRSSVAIQQRLWDDMQRVRAEYERLIHNELRVLRQRAAALPTAPSASPRPAEEPAAPPIDYLRFAHRFRGTEEHVQRCQQTYLEEFRNCQRILDVGCGRGEFLQVLKDAGVSARGIDSSEELVRICRSKGLEAERADLFSHLAGLPEASLDGIFCAQVIEHLPPHRVPEFVQLAARVLKPNGLLAIETPNPECLAIFCIHFYLDPTHTRPIPPALLSFYLEESGFGNLTVRRLSPAKESLPSIKGLPDDFQEAFFGALDYAILARRLT